MNYFEICPALHAIAFAPYMMLLPINKLFEICPAVHAPRKCTLPSTRPCLPLAPMQVVVVLRLQHMQREGLQ